MSLDFWALSVAAPARGSNHQLRRASRNEGFSFMESMQERAARILSGQLKQSDDFREAIQAAFDCCESPAEQLLMMTYVDQFQVYCGKRADDIITLFEPCYSEDRYVSFYPQVTIDCGGKKYRVDFLFLGLSESGEGEQIKVVVEVDGHDFHERTKEQARRDKLRDRALLRKGLPVLRFTGSEVFHDPVAVVHEIRSFARGEAAA